MDARGIAIFYQHSTLLSFPFNEASINWFSHNLQLKRTLGEYGVYEGMITLLATSLII